MIFYVIMGKNFCCKVRFITNVHNTEAPSSITYSTVVSREYISICITIAALNNVDVIEGDVENSHLSAPCRDRV